MRAHTSMQRMLIVTLALLQLGLVARASALDLETQLDFSIAPQSLATALVEFSRQVNAPVVSDTKEVRGFDSRGVRGRMSMRDALQTLLTGTRLGYKVTESGAIAVGPFASSTSTVAVPDTRIAQADAPVDGERGMKDEPQLKEITVGVPEILVVGSRSINADMQRTEDDPQPYVVFGAEEIRRSQSTTLEDFFKTRLPMNAVQGTGSVANGATSGNQSTINLRGLGANQTLILVDGRRMPGVNNSNLGLLQPDINGIPMAAIERIEVLPSTASGIYGGGATGGVINIIMRKDYTGADVSATYGSSFDGDAANYRFDGSTGFSLEDGMTHVVIAASHADSDPLRVGDRDFAARARALQLANNPSGLYSLANPPPAGYTSNIRSQNGSNLRLIPALGGTPLNSPFTYVPIGYAGPASDDGGALVANAGQYNLALPEDQIGELNSQLAGLTADSASLNLRRQFGARVEAFADVAWLDNEALSYAISSNAGVTTLALNAPNNPFTTPVVVSFPLIGLSSATATESETLRATAGAIVRLTRDWVLSADYGWARSRVSFRTDSAIVGNPDGAGPGIPSATALSNGTLDVMRDLNVMPLDWDPYRLPSPNFIGGPFDTLLNDATARLSGPLAHLPGGPLTLSGSVEYRDESAADGFQDGLSVDAVPSTRFTAERSQSVMSYYMEVRAPLISKANTMRLARALDLQASVRYDDYETKAPTPAGATLASRTSPLPALAYGTNRVQATKYTLGLRYVPVDDLALRASYGTGFLPPAINQLVPSVTPNLTSTLADPKRGGVSSSVTFERTLGGNPNLTAEDSKSWSAGMIFTPRFLAGLRLSVDYTSIKKTNEIASLDPQGVLNLEDLFPGRVTRDPLTPADIAAGYTGGVIRAINASQLNLAATRLEAYDIQADYSRNTRRVGDFHVYVVATWQPQFERQTLPATPFVDSAGFSGGVLEWRGNAGLTWDMNPWTVGWNTQYFDSYFAYAAASTAATIAATTLNQGSARIPSQTYHDIFAVYRFGDSMASAGRLLDDVEIMVGIQNLFDKSPPILAATAARGGYSTYGDPRLRRFSLTVKKRF